MVEHMSKLQKTFWKHWKGKDPWTYRDPFKEPDELEAEDAARKRNMKKAIRETERYTSLRAKYLTEVLDKLSDEIDGYKLRDHEIERILVESEKKGVIARLVSRN